MLCRLFLLRPRIQTGFCRQLGTFLSSYDIVKSRKQTLSTETTVVFKSSGTTHQEVTIHSKAVKDDPFEFSNFNSTRMTTSMDSYSMKNDSVANRVKDLIQSHKVIIFSKSYCPFCLKVKKLFENELHVPFKAIELDHDKEGISIQDYLKTITGQKTVPSVFIQGQHIGGCDSTYAAHQKGQLQALLFPEIVKATNKDTTMTTTESEKPISSSLSDESKSHGVSLFTPEKSIESTLSNHPSVETSESSSSVLSTPPSYDYDLIVIGGGSGGIACAREGRNFEIYSFLSESK